MVAGIWLREHCIMFFMNLHLWDLLIDAGWCHVHVILVWINSWQGVLVVFCAFDALWIVLVSGWGSVARLVMLGPGL